MANPRNQSQQIEGVVERLNFSKNGDRNGAVLDSGHFVHMKRSAAEAIDLQVGQQLEIEGRSKGRGSGGHEVIEVEIVNGVDLKSKQAVKNTAAVTKKAPAEKASAKTAKPKPAAKKKSRSSR